MRLRDLWGGVILLLLEEIPDATDVASGATARDSNVTVAVLINDPLPICITFNIIP